MWFLLLLLHSTLGDMFDDHMTTHINASIRPCHDFYSHVCPYPMRNSDIYTENLGNGILEKIRPYLDKDMQAVLRSVEMHNINDEKNKRNVTDTKKFIEQRCKANPMAKYYLESVLDTVRSMNRELGLPFGEFNCSVLSSIYAGLGVAEPSFLKLSNQINSLIEASAFSAYMEKDATDFEKHFRKVLHLFNKLRNHILREAKKSPWLETLLPSVTKTLRTVKFLRPVKENFTKAWTAAKVDYKRCYATLSGLTTFDARMCAILSFDMASSVSRITVFNAVYEYRKNTIDISPALLFSDLMDNKQEIILSFIIAHEIAHSIYTNTVSQPKNATCLEENMETTCKLFKKGFNCTSGYRTYQEDVPDWVAMQTVLFLYENRTVTFPSLTDKQTIFYILSITWCTNLKDQKANDGHSLPITRVNGILRQFQEFQDEFKCSRKDQMVAQKKCFLLGEDAIKKTTIFRE